MELEKRREKGELGTGPLDKLGRFSSLLIKDSLRIARLAFVDVSAAEMMTEDATNTEEWGPTTKTMAAISDASKNYDDYVRIVQVLRGRLSLTGAKKWRQVFKALTVMEYLLTHGPEQFIMDFREDKKRVEELTRFVFLDENLVDRSSALQRKAKQVEKLLVNEKFVTEQRRRAQTVSKGILGFGSQSLRTDTITCERPDLRKCNTHSGAFTPKVDDSSNRNKNNIVSSSEPSSPIPPESLTTNCQSAASSSSKDSVGDDSSPEVSSASTEWNPFDHDSSPTSSGKSMIFSSSLSSPIAGGWAPPLRSDTKKSSRTISRDLELCSTASSKQCTSSTTVVSLLLLIPPPPPGGSKVRSTSLSTQAPQVSSTVPDLILM